MFEQALVIKQAVLGPEDSNIGLGLNNLASVLKAMVILVSLLIL